MKNNTTKENKIPESLELPDQITLRSASIFVHEDDEGSPGQAQLTLRIPVKLQTFSRGSLDEYKKNILEYLRIETSVLFETIGYLGETIRDEPAHNPNIIEGILTIAKIGRGYLECGELIEADFDSYQKKLEKTGGER